MTKSQLLHKVRQFCSECMGGPKATEGVWPIRNSMEVAECCAPECIWYRCRFGKDPDKDPKAVERGRKLGLEYGKHIERNGPESTISSLGASE
jgi:hypothetical protein